MKKLLLGLFVFCLLFTGTAVHAGWVSDAVLKEILQFRASLVASAYNAYPSSYTDTSTVSTSASSTVVAAPIPFVVTPNGGEIIKMGSIYTITWKAPAGVSTVNIYIDTGIRCVVAPCPSSVVIANGVKNTGSYSWYVDPKITYGNGSGLKMVISNGNYKDSSDATFSIASSVTTTCPPAPNLAQCPTGQTGT
ncbi:MAG: Ser-Thr-rich GPI-anchored membrane family protein, partial [Candidatus Nomurabacteria bacterium]